MRMRAILSAALGAYIFSASIDDVNAGQSGVEWLESYAETLPEDLRSSVRNLFEDLPPDHREVVLRSLRWAELLDGESYSTELGTVLSAMAVTVDGCLLPEEYCAEARQYIHANDDFGAVTNSMYLLSGAMKNVREISDCKTDRRGFVDGATFKIGEGHIVLMTTTNNADASPCFVRDLGAS